MQDHDSVRIIIQHLARCHLAYLVYLYCSALFASVPHFVVACRELVNT